jgi:hypothetical protein
LNDLLGSDDSSSEFLKDSFRFFNDAQSVFLGVLVMLNSFLLNSILLIFQIFHFSKVIVTLNLKSFFGHLKFIFVLSSLFSGKFQLMIKLISSLTNKFELVSSVFVVLNHVVLLKVVQINFVLLDSNFFFVELTSSSLNIIINLVFVIQNTSLHLFIKLLLMKLVLSSRLSHFIQSALMGFLQLLFLEE